MQSKRWNINSLLLNRQSMLLILQEAKGIYFWGSQTIFTTRNDGQVEIIFWSIY